MYIYIYVYPRRDTKHERHEINLMVTFLRALERISDVMFDDDIQLSFVWWTRYSSILFPQHNVEGLLFPWP